MELPQAISFEKSGKGQQAAKKVAFEAEKAGWGEYRFPRPTPPRAGRRAAGPGGGISPVGLRPDLLGARSEPAARPGPVPARGPPGPRPASWDTEIEGWTIGDRFNTMPRIHQ